VGKFCFVRDVLFSFLLQQESLSSSAEAMLRKGVLLQGSHTPLATVGAAHHCSVEGGVADGRDRFRVDGV